MTVSEVYIEGLQNPNRPTLPSPPAPSISPPFSSSFFFSPSPRPDSADIVCYLCTIINTNPTWGVPIIPASSRERCLISNIAIRLPRRPLLRGLSQIRCNLIIFSLCKPLILSTIHSSEPACSSPNPSSPLSTARAHMVCIA